MVASPDGGDGEVREERKEDCPDDEKLLVIVNEKVVGWGLGG